jgi:hypothetical protein
MQGNARKIAWIYLDFLEFLWPEWAFSKGYSRKNKKNHPSAEDPLWLQSRTRRNRDSIVAERVAVEFLMAEIITPPFALTQQNVNEFENSVSDPGECEAAIGRPPAI